MDGTEQHDHDSGGEAGSMVTEYGLVAVIGATIAGLVVRWATGGAITQLLDAVLARVQQLVGV